MTNPLDPPAAPLDLRSPADPPRRLTRPELDAARRANPRILLRRHALAGTPLPDPLTLAWGTVDEGT